MSKREENQCNGKQKFVSKEEANRMVASLNKSCSNKVRSYKCGSCSGYHYGHEGKRKKMSKAEKSYKVNVNHKSHAIIVDLDSVNVTNSNRLIK